jgi:DNA-binding CsgD family transcriptional regulator
MRLRERECAAAQELVDSAVAGRGRLVAELAAAGRTRKEIAAVLFLSPKTVEAHLTHAFRSWGSLRAQSSARASANRRKRRFRRWSHRLAGDACPGFTGVRAATQCRG